MYPVIFGLEEILPDLVQDLCEGSFPKLYFIVIIDHLRTNQSALINVYHPADHSLIPNFGLDPDVLLIPSHQQPLRIPKLYDGQNYDENCENEGLDTQNEELVAPLDLD